MLQRRAVRYMFKSLQNSSLSQLSLSSITRRRPNECYSGVARLSVVQGRKWCCSQGPVFQQINLGVIASVVLQDLSLASSKEQLPVLWHEWCC